MLVPGHEQWQYIKVSKFSLRRLGDNVHWTPPLRSAYPRTRYLQHWRCTGFVQRRHSEIKSASCCVSISLLWESSCGIVTYLRRPPPKEQGKYERWSLVFFTRPGNSIELCALSDQSALIAEAEARAPEGRFQTGVTAYEWFTRRIKNQRINNRTVSTKYWNRTYS